MRKSILLSCFIFIFCLFGCGKQTNTDIVTTVTSTTSEHFVFPLEEPSCKDNTVLSSDKASCVLYKNCHEASTCAEEGDILSDELQNLFTRTKILSVENSKEMDEVDLLTFDVDDNTISTSDDFKKEELESYHLFWSDFAWLIPLEYRHNINAFNVYRGGFIQAYMLMNDDKYFKTWTFGNNVIDIQTAELMIETYIHEFFHLLSLSEDQVYYEFDESNCPIVFVDNACLKDKSYIKKFYDTFYNSNIDTSNEELSFVSEYANNGVVEDIAESFAYFVLTKKPEDTSSIRNQKVLFFYDYDLFVEMRFALLNRAITWLPNSRYYH